MAAHTLRAMASGGMYDQVGGGFARYSVDARWLVPHFEKMLYDNALLARAYLHGWQVTGEALSGDVATETLDWALREMRAPEGGFFSALDADSEGEEGKFYVWALDELRERGRRGGGRLVRRHRGRATSRAANILVARRGRAGGARRVAPQALRGALRARLAGPRRQAAHLLERADDLRARRRRRGARPNADYLDAARACAEFVLRDLRDGEGRLLRTFKDGQAKLNAYLEDHAFLLEALLTLYEATFEPRWFAEARALADTMIERFADDENGGFFETSSDHEQLVARRKDLEDHPIPAGNSSAAYGLLRLAALTGEHEYERRAVSVLRLLHPIAPKHPQAFGHLLQALDFHLAPVKEVALVGEDREELERVVRGALPPPPRAGRRRARRRAAARGPGAGRRPRRRLRLRALRLQGAGHRAGPSSQRCSAERLESRAVALPRQLALVPARARCAGARRAGGGQEGRRRAEGGPPARHLAGRPPARPRRQRPPARQGRDATGSTAAAATTG